MNKKQFFATTPKFMESLLAEELRTLGAEDIKETHAGVYFSGSLESAYRACLWSRLANSILLVLDRFPAETPEALYQGIQSVDWSQHFDVTDTFAVTFNTSRSQINHSHYGALKVKDAIVDQFRERSETDERPSVQTERPDILINVYLWKDRATLSLNLSGESLHRRGYREEGSIAPLKENLAAAILLRAGWPEIAKQGGALLDPMCGSGTLPIEAALMASDTAPGLQRDHWGFSGWKQHEPAIWKDLMDEAETRQQKGREQLPDIRGYDHNPKAVQIALGNVEHAGLHGLVHIEKSELENCRHEKNNQTGLVVINPPYGERLGADSDLVELYARLGETLKNNFTGWRASMITSNPELAKSMGLLYKRKHALYNGAIECELFHYDIKPESFVSSKARGPKPLPVEERSEGAQMFANRLKKNFKNLGRWAKREDIHCYRLYDADMPEYALAVDIYGDSTPEKEHWVHVQEYQAPKTIDQHKARTRLREALGVILDVLEISTDQLFIKVRKQQKGTAQYEKLATKKVFHEVAENDCRFLVNFEDYLDTGLFLDHRITRSLIAELAKGKRFLNLFAYTGTATVYAAKGGAASTTTIDMSNTYIDWAKQNMRLNGFTGDSHEYIQTNCLEWLDNDVWKRKYGLIFLDPPSFSTSKRMEGTFDVQRDHVDLIRKTLGFLEADGALIFSNNLRKFKMDRESFPELEIEDISRETLPKDFERNPRIHNCWKISRKQ